MRNVSQQNPGIASETTFTMARNMYRVKAENAVAIFNHSVRLRSLALLSRNGRLKNPELAPPLA